MRIDAHQHFWHYDAAEYGWIDDSMAALRRDFLPARCCREMDAGGLDACIAVQARQTLDETRWLLALADAHPFIAGVVGWVDLQAADVDAQLERLRASEAGRRPAHRAGRAGRRSCSRPAFCRGIALLERSRPDLRHPDLCAAAACGGRVRARFPAQRFVLDHLAKPDIRARRIRHGTAHPRGWRSRRTCSANYPVWSPRRTGARWTPDQSRPYLDVGVRLLRRRRLMIGSDWPVCTVAAATGGRCDVVERDYLRTGVRRPSAMRCWADNAARFWRLAGWRTCDEEMCC